MSQTYLYHMKSNYKSYLLSQLGIQEAKINPDELEKSAKKEKEEHPQLSKTDATLIAKQHLEKELQKEGQSPQNFSHAIGIQEDTQGHINLSGLMSPTAKRTPVIGMAVRGSSTGGFPSGMDQTGITPSTPTGRLGGYEPISKSTVNSKIVNKTPHNINIDNTAQPIDLHPQPIPEDPHPHQVQNNAGEDPQSVTGASTDGKDTPLKLKSAIPMDIDIPDADTANSDTDVNDADEINDMDGEESLEDEDKAKEGLNESSDVCQRCKGKGAYTTQLKDYSGKNTHGMGTTHYVPCDAPGCHGGKVDRKEYYKGWGIKSADGKKDAKLDETFKRHTLLMKEYLGMNEKKVDATQAQLWKDLHPDERPIEPDSPEWVNQHTMDDPLKTHEPPEVDPYTGVSVGQGAPVSDYDVNKLDLENNDEIDQVSPPVGLPCIKCGKPCDNDVGLCDACSEEGNDINTGIKERTGANHPFVNKFNGDKEKAGMVKVSENQQCVCDKCGASYNSDDAQATDQTLCPDCASSINEAYKKDSMKEQKIASISVNKLRAIQESITNKRILTQKDALLFEMISKALKTRKVDNTFKRHIRLMNESKNRD